MKKKRLLQPFEAAENLNTDNLWARQSEEGGEGRGGRCEEGGTGM